MSAPSENTDSSAVQETLSNNVALLSPAPSQIKNRLAAIGEASYFSAQYYDVLRFYHSFRTVIQQQDEIKDPLVKGAHALFSPERSFFRNLLMLRQRVYFKKYAQEKMQKKSWQELLFHVKPDEKITLKNTGKGLYFFFADYLPSVLFYPFNAFVNLGYAFTDWLRIKLFYEVDAEKDTFFAQAAKNILNALSFVLIGIIRLPFGIIDAIQEVFHFDSFWIAPFRHIWQHKREGHISTTVAIIKTCLHLIKCIATGIAVASLFGVPIAKPIAKAFELFDKFVIDKVLKFMPAIYTYVIAPPITFIRQYIFGGLYHLTGWRWCKTVAHAATVHTAVSNAAEVAGGVAPIGGIVECIAMEHPLASTAVVVQAAQGGVKTSSRAPQKLVTTQYRKFCRQQSESAMQKKGEHIESDFFVGAGNTPKLNKG